MKAIITTNQKSYLNLIFFTLIAIITTLAVNAQERSISSSGTKAELVDVETISVEAGTDLKTRERIIKEIRRQLPNLTIVNGNEKADITLVYRNEFLRIEDNRQSEALRPFSDNRERAYQPISFRTETVNEPVKVIAGSGYVLKNMDDKTDRLLLNFQSARLDSNFDRQPEISFARAFVKAYSDANKRKNYW
jgi:hypothetical protein